MRAHHKAWLEAHPNRSKGWLKQMMAEGFHIHHIDGDHGNNHPANLALIESEDHLRLHGLFRLVTAVGVYCGKKGGINRWVGKSQKEKSAHMKMMANKRWIRFRKQKRALREIHSSGIACEPTTTSLARNQQNNSLPNG